MSNDIQVYLEKEERLARFQKILGSATDANAYVQSVAIASQDEKLAGCTPQSIFEAALRAASNQLSCEPIRKEAQLIPRNRNIGTRENPEWVKEASFEPHYKGLYKMAMRSGNYRSINVVPVLNGQVVHMDITGEHKVYTADNKPVVFFPDYIQMKDRTNVIGLVGHSLTFNGQVKTVYMTMEEIEEHARKYSKAYQNDLEKGWKSSTWSNPDVRPVMEFKTVLRQLLSWADFSENKQLRDAFDVTDGAEVIDAEPEDISIPEAVEVDLDALEQPETKAVGRVSKTDQAVLTALVEQNIADNEHEARNIMSKCAYETSTVEKFTTWGSVYRAWRDVGKEVKEAADLTNSGEQPQ